MATTGPSATFVTLPLLWSRPLHFLFLFFCAWPVGRFSPPVPTNTSPLAVLAARTPVGETATDSTKGGESCNPDCSELLDGEAWAVRGQDVRCFHDEEKRHGEPKSRSDRRVRCWKSWCTSLESYPPLTSSLGRSGMNLTESHICGGGEDAVRMSRTDSVRLHVPSSSW